MPGKGLSKPVAWLVAILVTVAVALLCCSLCVGIPVWLNNLRLAHFAGNLFAYPLPRNTVVVERHSALGKVGNGNNCWYEARQSDITTLSREEIEQYYRDVSLPVVDPGSPYRPDAIAVGLAFEEVSGDGKLHFTLALYDIGPDTTLDFRCH